MIGLYSQAGLHGCLQHVEERHGQRWVLSDGLINRVTFVRGGSVMCGATSPLLDRLGLSSLEAISMQRD